MPFRPQVWNEIPTFKSDITSLIRTGGSCVQVLSTCPVMVICWSLLIHPEALSQTAQRQGAPTVSLWYTLHTTSYGWWIKLLLSCSLTIHFIHKPKILLRQPVGWERTTQKDGVLSVANERPVVRSCFQLSCSLFNPLSFLFSLSHSLPQCIAAVKTTAWLREHSVEASAAFEGKGTAGQDRQATLSEWIALGPSLSWTPWGTESWAVT